MKLYGVTTESLRAIVRDVSKVFYDGNVVFKKEPEQQGSAVNFSLRILDCSKKGSRRSNTGRKIAAACWHVHRDIMAMIFQHNSNARIVSVLADYRGINDFEISFPETGSTNFGSIAVPIRADRACNCETHEIVAVHADVVRACTDRYVDNRKGLPQTFEVIDKPWIK